MQALKSIADMLKDKKVDVVLYLDRLDFYRVERTDQEIMSAITNTLGPKIWRNTIVGLTHGRTVAPWKGGSTGGDQQGTYSLLSGHIGSVARSLVSLLKLLINLTPKTNWSG